MVIKQRVLGAPWSIKVLSLIVYDVYIVYELKSKKKLHKN